MPRAVPSLFEREPVPSDELSGYRIRAGRRRAAWRYRSAPSDGITLSVGGALAAMALVPAVHPPASASSPLLASVGLAAVGVLGLAVMYVGLWRLFNRHTLSVDRDWIRWESGPLPWRGVALRRASVIAMEVRAENGVGDEPPTRWSVCTLDATRKPRRLAGGFTAEEARYLVDEMNDAMVAFDER